jgi:hypothetical protein
MRLDWLPCWLCDATIAGDAPPGHGYPVTIVRDDQPPLVRHVHQFCHAIHTAVKSRDARTDLAAITRKAPTP